MFSPTEKALQGKNAYPGNSEAYGVRGRPDCCRFFCYVLSFQDLQETVFHKLIKEVIKVYIRIIYQSKTVIVKSASPIALGYFRDTSVYNEDSSVYNQTVFSLIV